MDNNQHAKIARSGRAALFVVLAAFSANGCALDNYLQPVGAPGPEIFMNTPSLMEAVDGVNANSNAIHDLYAEGATISVQGFPALRANLAAKRPKHLRLQATVLGVGGPALDVGSNNELFWFWRQQTFLSDPNAPQGVFFARHSEASRLPLHQVLPIEPDWLIQALGVVTIAPDAKLEGPVAKGPDEFEISEEIPSARGPLKRVLTIHSRYAWVMRQRLFGPNGELLVDANASRHRYYPDYGVTLPEEVTVLLAPNKPQQMSLRVFVGEYVINRLGDEEELFTMPEIEGQPTIDLADMLRSGNNSPATISPPQSLRTAPRTGYRPPPLRGYQR